MHIRVVAHAGSVWLVNADAGVLISEFTPEQARKFGEALRQSAQAAEEAPPLQSLGELLASVDARFR